MKRTLVERVAAYLFDNAAWTSEWGKQPYCVKHAWFREARRIIAMVRRHDGKEKV